MNDEQVQVESHIIYATHYHYITPYIRMVLTWIGSRCWVHTKGYQQ